MSAIQQVLTIETTGQNLRSEAIGWGAEDPRGAHPSKPVGICGATWSRLTPCGYRYPDPLRALADGWRLLAPPVQCDVGIWEWWLVREVTS